jgi:glycosyltransferase involved in cell wall biosynthesis
MRLLTEIMSTAGHTVTWVDWQRPHMPRVDVAIFLELWNPRLARYAKKTVGIFNLEWFQPVWRRDLPRITQLWAKSVECHEAFQRMRLRNNNFTGFASRDLEDLSVPRQPTALHLRGHSDFKNTQAVIDAWRADPSLPPLTIISAVPLEVPHYVRVLGRISDEDLRREMNTATYHVCPSRAEGWGHYITEALSVGAVVLTTDASPMNEHARPGWGVLIPPAESSPHGMVKVHSVSAQAIGDAMRRAVSIPSDELARMSRSARAHFERRNREFRDTALKLLERI